MSVRSEDVWWWERRLVSGWFLGSFMSDGENERKFV
jgi:hypothetical protein